MVILAVVMTISVISADDSPGAQRITVKDELKSVFTNAAIRAQAFNNQVMLTFKTDSDGFFKCTLKSRKSKSVLSTTPEDETEEEALVRTEHESSIYVWSGSDTYDDFGELAKLYEFEELVDEQGEIQFTFYPDGEATGPLLKMKILESEYELTVGRLNSQLQMTEVEY